MQPNRYTDVTFDPLPIVAKIRGDEPPFFIVTTDSATTRGPFKWDSFEGALWWVVWTGFMLDILEDVA
jgi:hypothetical protein